MDMFLAPAAAVVYGLLGAAGIAGITTGWVVPWSRARVLRPRLWGYGCLLAASGGPVFLYLGPLGSLGPLAPEQYGFLPWLGWLGFMAGLGLQMLAQRPGRAVTKTVS
ncbi:hypothetical protein ACWDBD_27865 [Streptomyces sp. NPDC001118]|uniref:hypothetical protein n=1 Tax=unclassified Streptomyces TaxID=2593676 RepID=UPI00331D5532